MSIVVFVVVFVIILLCYKIYSDKQWHKKPLQNFPFIHRGKVFWYSRSVATTIGVFCHDENGNLCVLANKRGKGTPDFQGYWNIVCGYLEHGVNAEENCQKEVFEETGLFIPLGEFNTFSIENNTENLEKYNFSKFFDGQIKIATKPIPFNELTIESVGFAISNNKHILYNNFFISKKPNFITKEIQKYGSIAKYMCENKQFETLLVYVDLFEMFIEQGTSHIFDEYEHVITKRLLD